MTERDIFSNPILADIYNQLTDGWQYLDKASRIRHQAIELIKQLLLRKLLDHYKAPQFFYLTLTDHVTDKVRKCLKQKYERLGQNISDEELEEAIANIVAAVELFTTQQIAKEVQNA